MGRVRPTAPGDATHRRFYELGVERHSGAQRPCDPAAATRALQACRVDERGELGGSGAAQISATAGHRAIAIGDGDPARGRALVLRALFGHGETQQF
jgi:hypothetical protein